MLNVECTLEIFLGPSHRRQPPLELLRGIFLQHWNFNQDLALIETQDQQSLLWIQFQLAKQGTANQIVLQSQITAAEYGRGIAVPQQHHISDSQWDEDKEYWLKGRHGQQRWQQWQLSCK